MTKPKLTRQGVRDLGYGKPKQTRDIPPKTILECPHLVIGEDRFNNIRCRDCGVILPRESFEDDPWFY